MCYIILTKLKVLNDPVSYSILLLTSWLTHIYVVDNKHTYMCTFIVYYNYVIWVQIAIYDKVKYLQIHHWQI